MFLLKVNDMIIRIHVFYHTDHTYDHNRCCEIHSFYITEFVSLMTLIIDYMTSLLAYISLTALSHDLFINQCFRFRPP